MTLITASNPGKWSRRCDATCHDAQSLIRECKCICGGKYHGKGSGSKALEDAQREHAAQILLDLVAPDRLAVTWDRSRVKEMMRCR